MQQRRERVNGLSIPVQLLEQQASLEECLPIARLMAQRLIEVTQTTDAILPCQLEVRPRTVQGWELALVVKRVAQQQEQCREEQHRGDNFDQGPSSCRR